MATSPSQDNLSVMARAYARWAPYYDAIYTKLLNPGRKAAVQSALAAGSTILEVGVGTGISLEFYTKESQVVGIDLSRPMLDVAKQKCATSQLNHVQGLSVMDACRLGLRDQSFDVVVGQYVITLVPDAEGALDEFARVLRPGGEIVLVNHFGRDSGVIAQWERLVAPVARFIGLSSEFKMSRIENWAKNRNFQIISIQNFGVAGFFTVVRLKARM